MKAYTELSRHEGNDDLFEAVEMSIVSSLWEVPLHLHAEGLRGTGKTTIMRAAKQVMPPINRIKGCIYNCDPENPHCPHHRHLSQKEIEAIGTEIVPRPFMEISHSAKLGTVIGSIDLAKITDPNNPTAALLPGLIPQAHRGIIFVDEINRLADTAPEITDVLLDLMGTKPGRVQIEETGLPIVDIPVQVCVWAASNPDEEPGPLQEIRRQLSDRFDLVIDMKRPKSTDAIVDILSQSELKKHSLKQHTNNIKDEKFLQELNSIAKSFVNLRMPEYLKSYIARTYLKYNLESFRAIEAIQHSALLNCALKKHDTVTMGHLLKVMPMALKHRVEESVLNKILSGDNKVIKEDTTFNSVMEIASSKDTEDTTSWENIEIASPAKTKNQSFIGKFFSSKGKEAVNVDDTIKASPVSRAKSVVELDPEVLIKPESN